MLQSRNQSRLARVMWQLGTASSALMIASDVVHVARLVSIGQLPSRRTESRRKRSASLRYAMGDAASGGEAHSTKLVSGTARDNRRCAGCIRSNTRRLGSIAARRTSRTSGKRGPAWNIARLANRHSAGIA